MISEMPPMMALTFQVRGQQSDDGFARTLERYSQIAVQRRPHITEVLLVEWPVEAVLGVQVFQRRRADGHLARIEWPAGDRVHDHERQDRDRQQHAEHATEPNQRIAQHAFRSAAAGARAGSIGPWLERARIVRGLNGWRYTAWSPGS